MAILLHIETSTKNCSVAVSRDGDLVACKEHNSGGYSHAEMLHPFITDVLQEAKISLQQIDAVSVSKGPGSYTGLRIGVSAVKGLCFSLDIPMLSVSSLEIQARAVNLEEGFVVPVIDARRMEVYSSVFDANHTLVRETQAEIIDSNSFKEYYNKHKVVVIGDGAAKCKEVINHSNVEFLESYPSAKNMIKIAHRKYVNKDFENVAYFEPFYLKDFIATKEKKKL